MKSQVTPNLKLALLQSCQDMRLRKSENSRVHVLRCQEIDVVTTSATKIHEAINFHGGGKQDIVLFWCSVFLLYIEGVRNVTDICFASITRKLCLMIKS